MEPVRFQPGAYTALSTVTAFHRGPKMRAPQSLIERFAV